MTTEREDVGKWKIYVFCLVLRKTASLTVYRHDTFPNIMVGFRLNFTFVVYTKIHVPHLLLIFTDLM